MEISNTITNEIIGLSKTKISSCIISKRSVLAMENDNKSTLPINSPLITNREENPSSKLSKTNFELKQANTPAFPSRSQPINLFNPNQMQMNKLFRGKKEQKQEKEYENKPMFRTLDRNKNERLSKPQLIKKEESNKSILDQKSDSKNNTTMETTPEIKQIGIMKLIS